MNLLEPNQLRAIETHLAELLGKIWPEGMASPFAEAIKAFVLAGGKRIRPQLVVWTWRKGSGFGVGGSEAAVLDLACAWELFHAFLLIHDDIIDSAEVRREQASLHRQLAALDHNCLKFGQNLAIVAGDLLFSAAMRIFHEVELPDAMYRRQLKLFSRVACTTGFGQAVDICQSHARLDEVCEETLLRGYAWKTAAYTFEGPMVCGAILAGLEEAAAEALSRFGAALGQAYQLQNDLIDLATPAHEGCDILQGKRTITLVRGRAQLGAEQREEFDRTMEMLPSGNGSAVAQAETLRRGLLTTDAPAQTRELIARLLEEARLAAGDDALPRALKTGMGELLGQLHSKYFARA